MSIVGEFLFDDEDKPHKDIDEECLMVCFYVPCVWDMKDADILANKYMATLRIKEAVKAFLNGDVNWEERLGELYASGYYTLNLLNLNENSNAILLHEL